MKSPLKMKRLPGILALGLVTLAVGAAGVPAGASAAADSGAHVSALTKNQQRAKKKALKKCSKKKARTKQATRKKRAKCKKAVIRKYKRISRNNVPKGVTKSVDLGDNYFTPTEVDLKVNDTIVWSWANIGGREPHNVSLIHGPSGVSTGDYASTTTADTGYRFKRGFITPGEYDFVCTLHTGMAMTVNVSK